MKQQVTTAAIDMLAPVPGNSGTITAGSVTDTSLVLNWTAGTDNATAQLDLQYAVYQSDANNINTVAACESNGTLIQDYTANLTTKTASGLEASTVYYFNVVVKDSAGNKAVYTAKQETTTAIPDTMIPMPGNGGTITTGSVADTSLVLNWTEGSDNMTAQPSLQYAVYQSGLDNIDSVTDCESHGTLIQDYTANLTTKNVTGLAETTTYYFNVVVKDSAGNKAVYTAKQETTTAIPDTMIPMPGNGGTITTGSVADTSLVLNWTAGTDNMTDQLSLQYAVYQSESSNIDTVANCENYGTKIQDYTANLATKNVTGLAKITNYYFNVVVKDAAGNKAVYAVKQQATTATPLPPAVTTSAIVGNLTFTPFIAGTSTRGGGEVTSDGGVPVTERGLCWNTTGTPTIAHSKVSDGTTGTGVFNASYLTGLAVNTTYYVRAFATNSAGTAYGNQVSFNSGKTFGTTCQGGLVFYNDGNGYGLVAAPGDQSTGAMQGDAVTAAASCTAGGNTDWHLASKANLDWMYSNLHLNGFGNFTATEYWSSDYTGYSSYYWHKSFANGGVNGHAGNNLFYARAVRTLIPDTVLPVPGNSGTITISGLSDTSLVLNWTAATDNISAAIDLEYTVYQSTSNNIDTVSNCESNGTMIQNYTANIITKSVTGLSTSITYFFNVIVKDSAGNKGIYTNKQQVMTVVLPTVITDTVTGVGGTAAAGGGNVTADGGAAVTERGLCWGTDPNPTTANSKISRGTGTGIFTCRLAVLATSTPYYVRAYATNSQGTAYGNQESFTTGSTYALRDTGPAGGLIFYDKGSYTGTPSWRYLEAASVDQTASKWGTRPFSVVGAGGIGIGTGYQNTIDIVTSDPLSDTAADICANLDLGGYSDWFLPSADELNQMYVNLKVYGLGDFAGSDYNGDVYWISTEQDTNYAASQAFYIWNVGNPAGTKIGMYKNYSYYVRAIRAF